MRTKYKKPKFTLRFTPRYLPETFSRKINPQNLKNEGFTKTDEITYEKDFSNVLTLKFYISRRLGKSYDWFMNEKAFSTMIGELEKIKRLIEKTDRNFKKDIEDKKEKACEQFFEAKDRSSTLRKDFGQKYKNFLEILFGFQDEFWFVEKSFFWIDVIKETKQLNLFINFLRLFFDTFRFLKKSKKRKISPDEKANGIFMYFFYLFKIQKLRIRKRYLEGNLKEIEDLNQIANTAFSEEQLADITEQIFPDDKFKYQASKLALDYASESIDTTPQNLKQIKKQEKKFANNLKPQVESMLRKNKTEGIPIDITLLSSKNFDIEDIRPELFAPSFPILPKK